MALLRKSEAFERIGEPSSPAQATALASVGIAEAKYNNDPTALVGDFDLEYLVLIILKMYEKPVLSEVLAGRFKDPWKDEEWDRPPQVCTLPGQAAALGIYLRQVEGAYFSQTYDDPQLQPFMEFGALAAFELIMTKQYPANGQIDLLFLLKVLLETFAARLERSNELNSSP